MWSGTAEKEAEFVLKQTLQHIVLTTLHPNTAISVIVQVRYMSLDELYYSVRGKLIYKNNMLFVNIMLSGLIRKRDTL